MKLSVQPVSVCAPTGVLPKLICEALQRKPESAVSVASDSSRVCVCLALLLQLNLALNRKIKANSMQKKRKLFTKVSKSHRISPLRALQSPLRGEEADRRPGEPAEGGFFTEAFRRKSIKNLRGHRKFSAPGPKGDRRLEEAEEPRIHPSANRRQETARKILAASAARPARLPATRLQQRRKAKPRFQV